MSREDGNEDAMGVWPCEDRGRGSNIHVNNAMMSNVY